MAQIRLSDPTDTYATCIDSGMMDILIEKTYLGVEFVTIDLEHLSVCMRDTGYEIMYKTDDGKSFLISCKGGEVEVKEMTTEPV